MGGSLLACAKVLRSCLAPHRNSPTNETFAWPPIGGCSLRLNPRGPGYTDNGLMRRDAPNAEPIGCVGAYDGDAEAHTKWIASKSALPFLYLIQASPVLPLLPPLLPLPSVSNKDLPLC